MCIKYPAVDFTLHAYEGSFPVNTFCYPSDAVKGDVQTVCTKIGISIPGREGAFGIEVNGQWRKFIAQCVGVKRVVQTSCDSSLVPADCVAPGIKLKEGAVSGENTTACQTPRNRVWPTASAHVDKTFRLVALCIQQKDSGLSSAPFATFESLGKPWQATEYLLHWCTKDIPDEGFTFAGAMGIPVVYNNPGTWCKKMATSF
jgi:hypothetical protein